MYSGESSYTDGPGNWYLLNNGGNLGSDDQHIYVGGDQPNNAHAHAHTQASGYGSTFTIPIQPDHPNFQQSWQAPSRHQQPVNLENAVYIPYQGPGSGGYVNPPSNNTIQPYQQQQQLSFQGSGGYEMNTPSLYIPRPTSSSSSRTHPPPLRPHNSNSSGHHHHHHHHRKAASTSVNSNKSSVNGYLAPPTGGRPRKNSTGSDTSATSSTTTNRSGGGGGKSSKATHPPGTPQPKSNRVPYTWDLNQDPSKTLACEDCPVRFARRHDLIRHRRIHTQEAPYVCAGCGRGYRRSDARKRHWEDDPLCRAQHEQNTPTGL